MQESDFRTILLPAIEVLPDGTRKEVTVRMQWFSDNIIDEPLEHPDAAAKPAQAAAKRFSQPEGKFSFVERES